MVHHLTDGGCTGCFFPVIMSRVCIDVCAQSFCGHEFSLEGKSAATGRVAPQNDIVKCLLAMTSSTFLPENTSTLAAFLPPDTSCQVLAIPVGVYPNAKSRKQTQSDEMSCLRLYSGQAIPVLHPVPLGTRISGQAI